LQRRHKIILLLMAALALGTLVFGFLQLFGIHGAPGSDSPSQPKPHGGESLAK
jgi:hypothetical protein